MLCSPNCCIIVALKGWIGMDRLDILHDSIDSIATTTQADAFIKKLSSAGDDYYRILGRASRFNKQIRFYKLEETAIQLVSPFISMQVLKKVQVMMKSKRLV
jgi:hypothetical protein